MDFWRGSMVGPELDQRPPADMVWIYGLFQQDHMLRYVGKTVQSPLRRRKGHWDRRATTPSHLGNWLRSLDERPPVRILGLFAEDQWSVAEQGWIIAARECGHDLVNTSVGGESGSAGVVWELTPARADAIRKSRGRKRSPDSVRRSRETRAQNDAQKIFWCDICHAGPFAGKVRIVNHTRMMHWSHRR